MIELHSSKYTRTAGHIAKYKLGNLGLYVGYDCEWIK